MIQVYNVDFAHGVTARGHPHAKPARRSPHDHKHVRFNQGMLMFALQSSFKTYLQLFSVDKGDEDKSAGGGGREPIGGGGGRPHGQ